MSLLTDVRLKITRRVNIGNYEHVEFEASATVSRDCDDDTPEDLRNRVLEEVGLILMDAYDDHLPKRRSKSVSKDADRGDEPDEPDEP
jgi:hypothetical protein